MPQIRRPQRSQSELGKSSQSKTQKILLVDGTNTVHSLYGDFSGGKAEFDQWARHFLSLISQRVDGSKYAAVEVFFDGQFRSLVPSAGSECLRVGFSEQQSADFLIVERIRALKYFGNSVTVITEDRELSEICFREEARVQGPASLARWLHSDHRRP